MKTLNRSEFETLINAKKPKIITPNREFITLTYDQAMEWVDDTAGWSHKIGFVAEHTASVFIGYGAVDTTLKDVTWHKIGGVQ
jgi:hypothetical protein